MPDESERLARRDVGDQPWSLSWVRVSKSDASWRSRSCSEGSPEVRFTIRPRRGQFVVFDKAAAPLLRPAHRDALAPVRNEVPRCQ